MSFAEIHPKLSVENGQFPRDFELPKRVDEFLMMDSTLLDRILLSYGLVRGNHSLAPMSFFRSLTEREREREHDRFSNYHLDDSRRSRLITLFEYLGVDLTGERRGSEAPMMLLSSSSSSSSSRVSGGHNAGALAGGRVLRNI